MLKIYSPETIDVQDSRPALQRRHIQRERPCDVCGCHDVQIVAIAARCGDPLPTAICVHCGMISHFRVPSDEELARYYRCAYRQDYHGEATPSARRVLKAWHCGQTIYRRLAPFMQAGDQVFEVGAGLGCTVKAFELSGYSASGIEPGQAFSHYSRRRLHADVNNRALEDVPREATYDVVLLVHVIEHFGAPGAALRHIHSLLQPGGRLYVECPNVGAPHAAPGKIFHHAHVHNFTPRTLAMLARVCGFRLLHRFSSERDRNLRLLFTRDEAAEQYTDPAGYLEALAALNRYSTLSYHMRPSYLLGRVGTLLHQVRCRVRAQRRVQRILQLCEQHARQQSAGEKVSQLRRAA